MPQAQEPNTSPAAPPPGTTPPGVTPGGTPAHDAGKTPVATQGTPQAPSGTPGVVTPPGAGAAPPTPDPGPRRTRLAEDGDDIPADAELLELSQKALKSRLDRYSRKSLKDRFGTDDPEAIQVRLDKLVAMEKAEEEKRLSEMTENDRLKEQLAGSERARLAAEQRYTDMRERQVLEQEDRRVVSIAERYIKPKLIKKWIPDLASYLNTLDEEDLKDPNSVIEQWFAKQVEETPEIGTGYAVPPPPEPPPPPARVPMTTGPEGARPASTPPSGVAAVKTAAPGRQNSMTDDEWKRFKRENGIHY